MVLRNERTLYKGECARCKRATISLYRSNSPYVAYCHDCWWSDEWAGEEYAAEYDPAEPLFEQLKKLQLKVPREALIILNSTNSDYGNNIRDSKDCYFNFQVANCENMMYSWWMVGSRDCINCHKIMNSELLFSCFDIINCYSSAFLKNCIDCSSCYFSYDLRGCNNCIFSYNLRNKSYCIGNRQYAKEEYEEEAAKIIDGSYKTLQVSLKKFEELQSEAMHRFADTYKCVDVTGNYMEECKESYFSFDSVKTEKVKNASLILNSKNSFYGYSIGPQPTELLYGTCVIKGGSNLKFCFNLFASNDCAWGDSLISCSNCIACVGLKKKEYCILNKQYSKDAFLKIKTALAGKGELSGYVPPTFSTFAYNETAAQDKYPLSKEDAVRQGYEWAEEALMTTGQETLMPEKISDNVQDVGDSILKEILKCVDCGRNYRVVERELQMYKKFNFPISRTCPQCRLEYGRLQRLPFLLWSRPCGCEKDHSHHKGRCPNRFETPYAPDRPEIVYCEQCYNAEVA